ncbi:glycosyl hydrolase family 18 protein [Herbivorax sp. ANBcel31]|uniref:glycosyl hydrolase family 18 protein n=1 Tax=Herbivorax sp. ANBcel31 TaxID=3069754 RepID=UPI0027B37EF9|nr:glycosyl hydrolase family 18 protein [Herbivorax sp. ANBcel31]MDQ2087701.1 glycosyl hydrolase family 18 protein [Herbivorax sp. ANBcel31]
MKKVAVVVIFILIASIAVYGFLKLSQSNKSLVPAFEEGALNLIIEDEHIILPDNVKFVDEEIVLKFDVVKKYFDSSIKWDKETQKAIVSTKNRKINMKTGSLDSFVNNNPLNLNIPVIKEEDVIYIAIEFLSDFYDIEVTYVKENNAVIIDYKKDFTQVAYPIETEAVLRKGRDSKYPILRKFDYVSEADYKNEMQVFEEYDRWYKVRTWDGVIGFIEKQYVVAKIVSDRGSEIEEKESEPEKEYEKINLVWDMVYTRRSNPSSISEMPGVNVISPTWFQLKNSKGDLINRAYSSYTKWAHDEGYKIWALLSNDFQDAEMTNKFLNDDRAIENFTKQILAYSSLYNLDGINIDFENFYQSDKDAFTRFVEVVTPKLKKQGLVVSVDVNDIPCYDKKALSEIVDYVMYMSYDQHWRTSPVAGSVAQVTWQERILKNVLEEEGVPKEKLLLGLPYYTRLWEEKTDENGEVSLSSVPLSMEEARNKVIDNNAEAVWDEESGQFYAEYKKEDSRFRIWLEDENSINLKSALVHKYNLAGVCIWSRNFASDDIWDVLYHNLNEIESYEEWLELNKDNEYVFDY